jgi:hypothetical protein
MERIQQKQQKSAEKEKSSEKLSGSEFSSEKPSEKGKNLDNESVVKQKLIEMRAKEAKKKENEKKQQESEKTQEQTKELPTQVAFQQGYFVQFLNKKPNKEEAEKMIEIWNQTKPNQRIKRVF